MLKIKRNRWRGWVRLILKTGFVGGVLYVLFGVCFGLARGVGAQDGDLIVFCRICRDYTVGDVFLMKSGELTEYNDRQSGLVAGKVLARLKVRDLYEGDE